MRLHSRPMSSNLAILDAEQFVGTAGIHLAGKGGRVKKAHPVHADDGPRKRAKPSSVTVVTEVGEEDGGDEKSTRARGRPRLDTKDQTAADRRRTQIRLAQRAYRSRKENSIQTLEKEVQVLHATNEEMSNAFMKLHDYAISHGILEMLPEFAQEMRSTMETFVVLAKQSSDSGSGGGGQAASPVVDSGASDKSPGHRRDQSSSPEVVNDVQPNKSTINNSVWGYTFDTDTEIDPALTMADLTLPNSSALTQAPLGYEITTTSTFNTTPFQFDNASLESFFSQDPPTTSSPSALTTTTPTLTPPSISPYLSALSNPNTLAFTEATFGRRLQRVAIESGYQLITMASPPPARYAKAFGFCLLFEPVDKIRARLRRGIDSSRRESLNYWASPFWALGGTGQHHQLAAAAAADDNSSSGSGEEKQQQQGELGNRGTVDVAKHGFGGNFGLGPFDEKTADARDRQLDPAMRMMLPGFEGEFFDPDEVEVYLRARGVRIRPGQDFVTAEVEPAWFDDGAAGDDGLWAVSPPSSSSSSSTMGGVPAWLGEDVFGDGRTVEELAGLSGGRKRIVTLDIDVLIRELVSRSVCLGRSSGFRPKDVNQAFWAATRSDNIMDF